MFWNRSLDWLLDNYPAEKQLFFLYGRNAYLKTRSAEGDRAFEYIESSGIKKRIVKALYKSRASVNELIKKIYLKIKT
jgi:hypothetical protein